METIHFQDFLGYIQVKPKFKYVYSDNSQSEYYNI